MTYFRRLFRWMGVLFLITTTISILAAVGTYLYLAPQLPSIDTLKHVQLQVPLRIYSHEGMLIAEYGKKNRSPLAFQQFPDLLIKAVLAAEDDRFYEHPGVDYQGILRAAFYLIKTGRKEQGGSTITMQVARNFFLSREKTYSRKLKEILLALKIEQHLSKQKILELYLNKIYLGSGAYGVAAAAQVYFGATLDKLELSQLAMIAGLPKAPSYYNPIANPEGALLRRDYVLRRMREVGYIDQKTFKRAMAQPITATFHGLPIEVEATFIAEMVRRKLLKEHGTDIYTAGYKVYTTIRAAHQKAANNALHSALLAYTQRHGFRGPENHLDLSEEADEAFYRQILSQYQTIHSLVPALVLATEGKSAQVYTLDQGEITLSWEGLSWARPYLGVNTLGEKPQQASDVLNVGDVIRIKASPERKWRLAQIPQVEGAIASLSPNDGAIMALSGGFSFKLSQFNRATQSQRQPGSSFKPFLYSSALNKGYTTASLINDAPVVLNRPNVANPWRPENYSGRFFGPTRLRVGLVHSRNLVSIRLLRAVGIDYAIEYIQRFGFKPEQLPHGLSLALGSGSASPLEMARGYAVFANGGYRIKPYFIERIENTRGQIIFQAHPTRVCKHCPASGAEQMVRNNRLILTSNQATTHEMPFTPAPRVITARNAYLISNMLQDVIQQGTGRRAKQLGRSDLSGKTGTTDKQYDAWFAGFNSGLVAVCWVGFDQPQTLGFSETGSRAALPMWISYMGTVLADVPEKPPIQPKGMVTVRIDPKTGLLARADTPNAIFEIFRAEYAPTEYTDSNYASNRPLSTDHPIAEQLF